MFQGQFYVTHKRSDILEGRYFISVYSLRQNCIENHNNGVVFAVSPLFTSKYRDNTCGQRLLTSKVRHVCDHFGAPKTPSQFFGSLKFLIFLRFLSMVEFFGSAKIIIFTIFKLVPILWVSQFLSTLRYIRISIDSTTFVKNATVIY